MEDNINFEEFYANRVQTFDRERKVFNDYVGLIMPSRTESHNLEWENKKLQTVAQDVRLDADKIRRQADQIGATVASTIDQIQSLKAAKSSRELQIARLGKLTNPVQRDVTYIVEERFTVKNDNKRAALGSVGPQKVLRTGEILKLEQRMVSETTKTSTYLQDVQLSIREAEEERHRYRKMTSQNNVTHMKEAKELYLEVDELEAQCFLAVSELLRLRVNIMVAQREEVEQLEHLERDKVFFVNKEEKTRTALIGDMTLMQRRVKNELQDSTRDFQKQLAALSVKLNELKLKEEWTRGQNKKVVSDDVLAEAALQAKNRYTKLRRRHALEMEGYQNEINTLRGRLSQVEKLHQDMVLQNTKRSRPQSAPALRR
ncbi:hypothetical protein B484DRAFT_397996 [Ochromonadaceae sp. CCMP2298]|nr:hypothetical protein B484DRAFT_397996 [Ochromonadaceae sp. CCMP2298]|mmetsp:Transcript_1547/g.3345  ORF Transcript_1547/g.3345 Transcript_1547/m.3345 type:complete len:373 (-) Transcript_1547:13-1131(-)